MVCKLPERTTGILASVLEAVGNTLRHDASQRRDRSGLPASVWFAASAAVKQELATQLGITSDAMQWLAALYAVRVAPWVRPDRKQPSRDRPDGPHCPA